MRLIESTRLPVPVIAGMLLAAHAGCGGGPVPEPDAAETVPSGPQTLTIHVPEMGERLKLM